MAELRRKWRLLRLGIDNVLILAVFLDQPVPSRSLALDIRADENRPGFLGGGSAPVEGCGVDVASGA